MNAASRYVTADTGGPLLLIADRPNAVAVREAIREQQPKPPNATEIVVRVAQSEGLLDQPPSIFGHVTGMQDLDRGAKKWPKIADFYDSPVILPSTTWHLGTDPTAPYMLDHRLDIPGSLVPVTEGLVIDGSILWARWVENAERDPFVQLAELPANGCIDIESLAQECGARGVIVALGSRTPSSLLPATVYEGSRLEVQLQKQGGEPFLAVNEASGRGRRVMAAVDHLSGHLHDLESIFVVDYPFSQRGVVGATIHLLDPLQNKEREFKKLHSLLSDAVSKGFPATQLNQYTIVEGVRSARTKIATKAFSLPSDGTPVAVVSGGDANSWQIAPALAEEALILLSGTRPRRPIPRGHHGGVECENSSDAKASSGGLCVRVER